MSETQDLTPNPVAPDKGNPEVRISENREPAVRDKRIPEAATYPPAVEPLLFGVENLIEVEKQTLQLYGRQITTAIDGFGQLFPMLPSACLDASKHAIAEILRIQIQVLDSMSSRSMRHLQDEEIRPESEEYQQQSELLRESAGYFLAIHRRLVDVFIRQLQSFSEAMRAPFGESNATPVTQANSVQLGPNAILQAQMKFWEVMLRPLQSLPRS